VVVPAAVEAGDLEGKFKYCRRDVHRRQHLFHTTIYCVIHLSLVALF
jgi:hypothetical protein